MLIQAGHDPAEPAEAWRGETLCLHIRSIGEAAEPRRVVPEFSFDSEDDCEKEEV
jgi:hypothetical protein